MSKRAILSTLFVFSIVGGYFLYRNMRSSGTRSIKIAQWFRNPESYPELTILQGEHCGGEHSSYVERESFGITVLAKQNQPKDSQNEV